MDGRTVVMRCCICGREKTAAGWLYPVRSVPAPAVRPGFCELCYELEIRKIHRRRLAVAAGQAQPARL